MVIFDIESYNYLAVPFLMLFVGGYYWAGCTTLWEEFQGKLRWQASAQWRLPTEKTRPVETR